MLEFISRYTDIICVQSQLLTDGDVYLSATQHQAVKKVVLYTNELLAFLKDHHQTHPHLTEETIRHEIINFLTPIVGYIDMLADEWIGCLAPNQQSHVEIIYESVHGLRKYVLSQQFKVALCESA